MRKTPPSLTTVPSRAVVRLPPNSIRPSERAISCPLLVQSPSSETTPALSASMLPLLIAYPIWGLIQHFLLQALVAWPLAARWPSRTMVVLFVSVLFALVHWPDPFLMGATFVIALCFTPIYLRWRNLWPLGFVHGWLGVLAYYWLLGRDPWLELF